MRRSIAYAANEATLSVRAQLPIELATAEIERAGDDKETAVQFIVRKFQRNRLANMATPREAQERTTAAFLVEHHDVLWQIFRAEHHSWRSIRLVMSWSNKTAQDTRLGVAPVLEKVVSDASSALLRATLSGLNHQCAALRHPAHDAVCQPRSAERDNAFSAFHYRHHSAGCASTGSASAHRAGDGPGCGRVVADGVTGSHLVISGLCRF